MIYKYSNISSTFSRACSYILTPPLKINPPKNERGKKEKPANSEETHFFSVGSEILLAPRM